jgi:hypothetical protein
MPRLTPKPTVNADGIRTLEEAGEQWKTDKLESDKTPKRTTIRDYLANWNEFVAIARRLGVTEIGQFDKALIRKYRSKIMQASDGSPNFYSNRFRHVKAILRHTLVENDAAGVDESKAGYILLALRMLKTKTTKAGNRYLSRDGFHDLDYFALKVKQALPGRVSDN